MRFPLPNSGPWLNCALAGLLLLLVFDSSATAQPSGHSATTREPVFRIPFRYDEQTLRTLNAVEVLLFVSQNGGRTWDRAQAVVPSAGAFQFRAVQDGEYCFAVRTRDSLHRTHPEAALEPELRVVLDRQAPVVQLRLQRAPSGTPEISWTVSDTGLDLQTLALEQFRSSYQRWEPVAIEPATSGLVQLDGLDRSATAVRMTVRDHAGNVTQRKQMLAQPMSSANSGLVRQTTESAPQRTADAGPEIVPVSSQRTAPEPLRIEPIYGNAPFDEPRTFQGPANSNPLPNAGNTVRTPRIVNTREFQIAYAVESVGSSGVGGVELYITQNGGQKWWRYGDDHDMTSPADFKVLSDGTYGFSIRIRSGAGLVAPPPQPGQKPEVVVIVDGTPPAVQMLPVENGPERQAGRVLFQWRCSDANLPARSVMLAIANSPEGPWDPITDWIPNTGRHGWAVPNGLPGQVFVRLTVRDFAGNVTSTQLQQPLLLDLNRPTVRILDVQPTGLRD